MISNRSIQVTPRPTGCATRFGGIVFFLVWTAISGAIALGVSLQVMRESAPFAWRQADCTILESSVKEIGSNPDYAFDVRYTYNPPLASAVESPARVGTEYRRAYKGASDYSEAQRLVLRYPPGTHATCYVDPANPAQAVLARQRPGMLFVIPLPLLFLAIGVGGLWASWRGPKAKKERPISSAGLKSRKAASVGVALFGIFFLVGLAVAAYMSGSVRKALAAREWTPVDAVVVSSNVRSHRGDESTTYSVNVLYAYRVGGREYRSNRYGFLVGSSSGYEGKRQIVSRYSPGQHFTAYVNPADPTDAVIERGVSGPVLILLIPLVFVGIGAIGLYYSLRAARGGTSPMGASPRLAAPLAGRFSPSTGQRAPQAGRLNVGGSITLRPRSSPLGKLIALSIICVLWDGVVSVFVYQVFKGWSHGRHEVCLSLILIPFAGVGLGLVVAVFYTFLGLFNPRCTLTLDRGPALGERLEIRWSFDGRYDKVHRLVVRVEGREEATYRQGTDTRTDKLVFHRAMLIDTASTRDIRAGKTAWQVPAETMHTFSAPNNKIAWLLTLHGHIAGWPDVKEEYVLDVAPMSPRLATSRSAPLPSDVEESGAPRAASLNETGGQEWT